MKTKHTTPSPYYSRLFPDGCGGTEYRIYRADSAALIGGGYLRSAHEARRCARLEIDQLERGVHPTQQRIAA